MSLDFFSQLNQFHFIRPELLWLLPLSLVFWFGLTRLSKTSQWEDYIPKEMLAVLRVEKTAKSLWIRWAWLLMWLILGLAAAGPTWIKQAVPTVQNQKATVILLDLSPSMLAQDLKPDRLTRAKYKLIDILRKQGDGQAALIAYAGDAHTVSPLTDDPKTIEALLPALSPSVMPGRGSNTEAAVELAEQLLIDAGVMSGELLLITDGVSKTARTIIGNDLSSAHRLSILAVGSNEAAPVPAEGGGFLRKANGEIVLSAVNTDELAALSRRTGGKFAKLSADDSDVQRLINDDFESSPSTQNESNAVYDAWSDMGHWLVLIMLPLFVFFFRKGLVYCLPLVFLVPLDSQADTLWEKLWKTPDQRATELVEQESYADAAQTFKRQDWAAVADYKNGDYDAAVEKLDNLDGAENLYNKANALALSGKLKEAIEAYDRVLEKQNHHEDATHNKQLIEELLKQQENQNNSEQNSDNKNSDQDKSEKADSEQESSEQQQSDKQQQSEEQQQGQQDKQPQDDPQQGSSEQESQNEQQEREQQAQAQQQEQEQEKQSEEQAQQQPSPEQEQEKSDEESDETAQAAMKQSHEPLKDSSEQWLRTIEDDPSGLLRRKFEYQNWLRQQQGQSKSAPSDDERY